MAMTSMFLFFGINRARISDFRPALVASVAAVGGDRGLC